MLEKEMRIVIYLLMSAIMIGCSPNVIKDKSSEEAENPFIYATIDSYRIGVDDVLSVNVWKNPDLSVTVPVRPDGKISIPLIGDLIAGGKEPMVVADEIKKKLAKFIREPQVAVMLTNLQSHQFISRIRITGAVNRPISLPFRQGMTVLDAILEAGSLNEFASPNNATLFRKEENKTESYDVYLGDILNSGKLETNYELLPGDIITIPERIF